MAYKKIKKVAVTPIEEKTAHVYDTTNIDNKNENTYSANIIDGLVQRHMMRAFLNAGTTVTATSTNQYVLVPLDKYTLVGNKLSFSNNGIKIGKGVSKIRLDAMLNSKEVKANFNKGLAIYKNGTSIAQTLLSDTGTRSYSQNVMMGQPIDVVENDIIQMYIRAVGISENTNITVNGATAGTSTYITIEVLE